MNWRFFLACGVIILALGVLIFSAVTSSAKAVVTVSELISGAVNRDNIRVGARVTQNGIQSSGGEKSEVRFTVRDIPPRDPTKPVSSASTLAVIYLGLVPDSLKAERDVILEGHFDGRVFHAKNLMTQCPSKYQPPVPGN